MVSISIFLSTGGSLASFTGSFLSGHLSGMDILKNDVNAVLGQIFDTKLKGNERHSTMTPGSDKAIIHFHKIFMDD